ncbi:hypothetical protein [Bifidobacterium parmae]|uniref:Uncharacterized protein n=1 Tax=Bifidobacterium parmae TaxID=361854 RepID=A0A2N5IVM4_9BIFI|nr:hypothetical protein [Bifidobacterium parmae]PLS26015.1 hypothetical protein Uis4E_2190 [Bifidobacterium parmae]
MSTPSVNHVRYMRGERPDLRRAWMDVAWIVWGGFWTGFALAIHSWALAVVSGLCLAVWLGMLVDHLTHLTWHIIEITAPAGKGKEAEE